MAYTVASALTPNSKFKLVDFLLRWGGRRHQSAEDQLAIFRGLAARRKGTHGDDS